MTVVRMNAHNCVLPPETETLSHSYRTTCDTVVALSPSLDLRYTRVFDEDRAREIGKLHFSS